MATLSLSIDAKLLTIAAGVRGFGQGFIAILIVLYAKTIGFDPFSIGILLALAYAGSVLANILVSLYADQVGRKRTLLLFSVVQFILPMVIMLANESFYLMAAASFIGALTVTGSGSDQFQAIEQASLPHTTDRAHRNFLFSMYNVPNSLLSAIGSLFVGVEGGFEVAWHMQRLDAYRVFFVIYAVLGLVLLILYSRLSRQIELSPAEKLPAADKIRLWTWTGLKQYAVIIRMSALFAFDTFGSGLLTTSLLSLWLVLQFNATVGQLAVLFFVAQVVQTISLPLAAKIADRIGLMRTMVLTQLPNNIFTIIMAFSPTFEIAVAIYMLKALFASMDTPSRQAYTIMVVKPDQRTAAGAVSNMSRGIARSLSSGTSGYMIQMIQTSAPFFGFAGIKLTYDLLFYLSFRHQKED